MSTNSVNEPPVRVEETRQIKAKAEHGQLLWRFVLAFGLIVGVVAIATMVAHWMRPLL